MFYSKVVNLPTANTPYLLRTLLGATDPNVPLHLSQAELFAVSTNAGVVAVGDGTMAAVTDGRELDAEEGVSYGGVEGLALDTSSTYVIGSAANQKVLVQGHTY